MLQKKSAVQKIGRQFNNTWMLGEDICITSSGYPITSSESKISNVFSGSGIPSPSLGCNILLPYSTEPLNHLLTTLFLHMGHNFYATLLLIGSAAFVLHYQELIEQLRYCPIALAFGVSGTVKLQTLNVHSVYLVHGTQNCIVK